MALVKSGNVGGTSKGGVLYELYADQTGGSGTQRTIKITLKLKLGGDSSSPSWFGYAADWAGYCNGSASAWLRVKGTESWSSNDGWRSYTWTHTTDVGTTSSKTIQVGFYLDSSGSNLWDTKQYADFTVSSTNSGPYFSSGQCVTLRQWDANGAIITNRWDGTENEVKIPENVSAIHLSWPAARDNDGDSITYEVWNQQNDGAWSKITETGGLSYIHQIGTGNQDRSYDYYVVARDSKGARSSDLDATQFKKNKLTGGILSSSSQINFDTKSITLSWSAGSNTNGAGVHYGLYCNGINIYNWADITGTSITIPIDKEAPWETGPYLWFDQIRDLLRGSSYQGNLTFTLYTKNNYGSQQTSSCTIWCDLRTSPNAPSSATVDTTNSTAYKKVNFSNNYYFIPEPGKYIRLNWGGASDKLGGSLTYDIQVKIGNGSFNTVATGISGTSYNYYAEKRTNSDFLTFKVIAKTSYGYTAPKDSNTITLHYYDSPKITVLDIVRTDTSATIPVIVKTPSSIPNISTVGSWSGHGSGQLTASQNQQNIVISNLTSEGTYEITITYNDNTGFSANQISKVKVSANNPMFAITKDTVSVGCVPDNKYKFKVNGITGTKDLNVYGYKTTNTAGSFAGKWTKVATIRISNQYGDFSTIFNILDSGSGSNFPTTGKVILRVKQQRSMGEAPEKYISLSSNERISTDCLKLITTENSSSITEVQLWFKNPTSYTVCCFSPITSQCTGGSIVWYEEQPYQDSLPAGHVQDCIKLHGLTAQDVGALSLSGGTVEGDIYMGNNRKMVLSHNEGLASRISDGTVAYLMYVGTDNRIKFGHNNRGIDINSNDTWINGYKVGGQSKTNLTKSIPTIESDGVMEVGQYIDFHRNGDDRDFSYRITCDAHGSLSCSGMLTVNSDIKMSGANDFVFLGKDRKFIINGSGRFAIGNQGWTACTEMEASKFVVWSDREAKTNIQDLEFDNGECALDKISKLGVFSYNFKSEIGHTREFVKPSIGLIAQDVAKLMPELVVDTTIKNEEGEEVDSVAIDLYGLLSVTIKAVQELREENNILKNKINEFKGVSN